MTRQDFNALFEFLALQESKSSIPVSDICRVVEIVFKIKISEDDLRGEILLYLDSKRDSENVF